MKKYLLLLLSLFILTGCSEVPAEAPEVSTVPTIKFSTIEQAPAEEPTDTTDTIDVASLRPSIDSNDFYTGVAFTEEPQVATVNGSKPLYSKPAATPVAPQVVTPTVAPTVTPVAQPQVSESTSESSPEPAPQVTEPTPESEKEYYTPWWDPDHSYELIKDNGGNPWYYLVTDYNSGRPNTLVHYIEEDRITKEAHDNMVHRDELNQRLYDLEHSPELDYGEINKIEEELGLPLTEPPLVPDPVPEDTDI